MHQPSLGTRVGRRIAMQRRRAGVSLSALSRAVYDTTGGVRGTSRTALRNLENGRVDAPRKEVIQAVASALDVDEGWLWTGEYSPTYRASANGTPAPPPEPSSVTAGLRWMSPEVRRLRERLLSVAEARLELQDGDGALERRLDRLVLGPLQLLDPADIPLARVERFASDVLEALLEAISERDVSSSQPPDERTPWSVSGSRADPALRYGTGNRRQRDGLTWRLM